MNSSKHRRVLLQAVRERRRSESNLKKAEGRHALAVCTILWAVRRAVNWRQPGLDRGGRVPCRRPRLADRLRHEHPFRREPPSTERRKRRPKGQTVNRAARLAGAIAAGFVMGVC